MAKHKHDYKFSEFLGPESSYFTLQKGSADDAWQFKSLYKCACGSTKELGSTKEEVQAEVDKLKCPHCKGFGEIHESLYECLPLALERISCLEERLDRVIDSHQKLIDHLRAH